MIPNLKNNKWFELGAILCLGLGFYILHFYPYLASFGESIFFFNDPDDAKIYSWNAWHFAHQIKQGSSPFYTDYILSPDGTSVWMHAYTIWFGMLNLVIGQPALSINLGIALQLVAAFVGFYFLAKKIVVNIHLSIVVAYISVFNSYVLAKCGVHYNLVLIGIFPFLLLNVLQLLPLKEGKLEFDRSKLVRFVLLLLVAFFMDYYIVFYTLAFLVVYMIWYGGLNRFFDTWNWKKSTVVLGLVGVGHVVLRLIRIWGWDEKGAIYAAGDVRLLWTPGSNTLMLKEKVLKSIPYTLNDNKLYIGIFIGVYFLLAILLFFRDSKSDKTARFLLFASAMFLMVTLPVIRIMGKDVFYFFTGLVHYIPFVNNVRSPDRFILLFLSSSAMFMGRVIYLYLKDNKYKMTVWVAITLVFSAYLDHAQEKMSVVEATPLATGLEDCKDKVVLMLPFGIRDGFQGFGDFDENHVLLQQKYQFKMPSGYLSRVSDDIWERYRKNTFYDNLVHLQLGVNFSKYDWHSALIQNGIEKIYITNCIPNQSLEVFEMLESLPSSRIKDKYGTLYTLHN